MSERALSIYYWLLRVYGPVPDKPIEETYL